MRVIETDERGAPAVIDVPGEGRSRVGAARFNERSGEWEIVDYYLIEPSPEYLAGIESLGSRPSAAVPRLTAPGLTFVVPK